MGQIFPHTFSKAVVREVKYKKTLGENAVTQMNKRSFD